MKGQDNYIEVKEYRFPSAIVRVHIPDLTEEEREKRMARVKLATVNLMKGLYKAGDEKCGLMNL